ncbi:type IV toxin-antitoxin system AbiEi family antitoxin domain-containing protein [Micromonospora inyonensis]|uniref:Transcriptional regulator, AbiEi antitoxin, Type IV TA system n=1 Tax=Micromonospora inyonensis TaxID=47866 RepID=A0A1C6RHU9_9ACTN|nr:type IV toxin-antitoxin system AbiEi family antitoxin domain-containing protein [Micromonospora inyonensis]SCL16759.1 Transcriptional regulator, AbiEi antitoxin, Type IV TA system [Micromonospora inyonensis]
MADDLYRYPELRSAGNTRGAVRHAVEAGRLRRVTRGIYTGSNREPGEQLRAMLMRLPAGAVVGFHTGAHLHGFGDVSQDDLHVIVPAGSVVPKITGVVVHEVVLPVPDPVMVSGVPVAPAARCAIDLARTLRRIEALPILDLALRSGACRLGDLEREVRRHDRLRGVRQARQLVPLADARSECRQESQLRLVLVDGGLPPPEPQIWISDEWRRRTFRLDLGYRAHQVGVEYDGGSHLTRERLRSDRARMNWLSARGWTMRYFTDRDLYLRPDHIVREVRQTLLLADATHHRRWGPDRRWSTGQAS